MADAMDRVQQRVEEELQRHLRKALTRPATATREQCVVCCAPIPPARQNAIPGVQCCVTCQEIGELKSKHYQSKAL